MDRKTKVINLTTVIKSVEKAEGDDNFITIKGMASTSDPDRVGDIIPKSAWEKGGLDNFKKNPIILFNHNHNAPIGKGTSIDPTDEGLELEAKISRKAGNGIADLIEDGVLGAFSVSFLPKDLDYYEETDGFIIKDAELLEVSVVSVPCHQAATFSVAKSFDSMEEYEDFKKQLKETSVDLAGQSLAGKEDNSSSSASEAPEDGAVASELEINMDPKELQKLIDEAVKKATAEAAAKEAEKKAKAQREAEEKAAQEKAAAEEKAKQEEETKSLIATAVSSGAEELISDFQNQLAEKDAKIDEVIKNFKSELEAHNEEITKMRQSKRVFSDRKPDKGDLSDWGKEFLGAKLVGLATGKGWDTDYANDLFEKAGVNYTNAAADIDQEVANAIEKEIRLELRAAMLFREIRVNGGATVLPIQPESEKASWATAAASGNLEKRGDSDNEFDVQQVILNAYRLISSTYIDDDTDEQVLINLIPMLIDAVAHAHARAIDDVIINGNGTINGLDNYASTHSTTLSVSGSDKLTTAILLGARQGMGKYGINPRDLAYVVSQNSYYDLLEDSAFANLDEVGSDLALKVTGTVGGVYGSPVVVSDNFPTEATGAPAAIAVNVRNYVIPRLRDVRLERDREVANQRDFIVAAQSLGFEELVAGTGNNQPAVKVDFSS